MEAVDLEQVALRAQAHAWQTATMLVGPDLTIRWASANIAVVIGWERADLEGLPAYELLHPDDTELVANILSMETTLNPSWRAGVGRRIVQEVRLRTKVGSFVTIECSLTNLLKTPDVGMLMIDVALPSQYRYVDSAVELTRVGGDISDVLALILDQFTTGDPSQPAAVVFDHNGVLLCATSNAPEPYGTLPSSTYVATWDIELFESANVDPVGIARFWCPLQTQHPFDVRSAERVSRQAAVAIGRHRANTELVRAAHNDALTGIANRRALNLELQQRLSRRDEVLLAYLDLDGFKEINDRLGHAAGDHVLKVVADRLASSLRVGDIAARIGGDEFVLLFAAPAPKADVMADRLSLAINAPIYWGEEVISISASIGFGAGESDADALLRSADRAMLTAKRSR